MAVVNVSAIDFLQRTSRLATDQSDGVTTTLISRDKVAVADGGKDASRTTVPY